MPEPTENDVNPAFVVPAAQGPGDHLTPRAGGVERAAEGPGDHLSPDFPTPRAPTGDHLDNWNESNTVEPVATRPPTGDHLTPDLP